MKHTKQFLTILFVFLTYLVNAQTDIYLDATKGSDTNGGTSWTDAYATFDAAMVNIDGAAATTYNVYVAQGSYLITKETLLKSGVQLNLYGGYPVGGAVTSNPLQYVTSFDTNQYSAAEASVFRLTETGGGVTLQDIQFANIRKGGNSDGALITVDGATDKTLILEDVIINNWEGGSVTSSNTVGDKGAIYIYGSSANPATNIQVNISNSLIEHNVDNAIGEGYGTFLSTNYNNENIDVNLTNSIFRNTQGQGVVAALFRLLLDSDDVNSSLTITNSKFYANKRGLAAEQSPSVIEAWNLPVATITGNEFLGNNGGNAGVFEFQNLKTLSASGNIYQENYAGQSAGVYGIYGSPTDGSVGAISFLNEQFFSNYAKGVSGGAIRIDGNYIGTGTSDYNVSITTSDFKYNHTDNDGGAVYIDTTENIDIISSTFCENYSDSDGGALYVGKGNDTSKLTITGSQFYSNYSTGRNGGAILTYKPNTQISSTYVDSNYTSSGNGGALYFAGNDSVVYNHLIDSNTVFINNQASGGGGAIFAYSAYTGDTQRTLNINSVYFVTNTAGVDGGAIKMSYYNFNSANSFYDGNIATSGDGGAICQGNTGAAAKWTTTLTNDVIENNTSGNDGGAYFAFTSLSDDITINGVNFYKNTSGDDGGAFYLQNGNATGGTVNVLSTTFDTNAAATSGGAISVINTLTEGANNSEIDLLSGSTFYGNTVAGSTTDTANNERSDIYLSNAIGIWSAGIKLMTNNNLQFEAIRANYPQYIVLGSWLGGFAADISTNTQQTTALAPPSAYTLPTASIACAIVPPVKISPIIYSSNDTTSVSDIGVFQAYTQLPCPVVNAYVSFTGVTTQIDTLPTPPNNLRFTYYIIDTNNNTGAVTVSGVQTLDQSNATFVVDQNATDSPRYRYLTYYLDVTGSTQLNHTYSYVITLVEELDASNNILKSTDYTFTDLIRTTLFSSCPVCTKDPNTTGTALETNHGITTLQRAGADNDNWPMVRKGAWTALESKTKGFVITRVAGIAADAPNNPGQPTGITTPQEGMMIYDIVNKCLKIYDGTKWSCFSEPGCPTP